MNRGSRILGGKVDSSYIRFSSPAFRSSAAITLLDAGFCLVRIMGSLPWVKWYTGDWLKSNKVGSVSPMARGIWFDALCHMIQEKTDRLTGGTRQFRQWCRCDEDEFKEALKELVQWKVCRV